LSSGRRRSGIVHLVGAGPGDPGLITVRGAALLRRADVVICDALVPPDLLRPVRPGAEVIRVGTRGGARRFGQEAINRAMLARARRGLRVVRLKGGDPSLFGRGGEEGEVLARARVPFEVVPGVTAALGAAATTGIPLTHRRHASAVHFATGHVDPEKPADGVDGIRRFQIEHQAFLANIELAKNGRGYGDTLSLASTASEKIPDDGLLLTGKIFKEQPIHQGRFE